MTGFERLWKEMETNLGERSYGLLRRRLTTERDDGLFVGIDPASGQRLFLVDLPQGIDFANRRLPRWTEVQVERFVLEPHPLRVRVKIGLADVRFADVFGAFAEDLYRALRSLEPGPQVSMALEERLEKWNRFFREHGPEGLNEEEQRGLFGELLVLRRHVLPHLPGIKGTRTWNGPGGADHDFQLPGGCVEAKTVGMRPAKSFHISNERQLDESDCKSLYLYWANLELSESGESLPHLVDEIRGMLKTDKFAMDTFEQKLLMAGYLDVHAPNYRWRYRILEEALCRVQNGFPRITNPANGISFVRYDLAVEACRPFQVDVARSMASLVKGGSDG
jgi:hypothetical protein